jgi:hypothetical protein
MSTHLQTLTKATSQLPFTPVRTGIMQRKCACGQHTVSGGDCEECRKKNQGEMQQRAAVSPTPVNSVPPIVHDVLSSPGQPLDAGTKAFMEPRFGHDFSGVRVHTDSRAAESAQVVNAQAYTVGRDVVFGTGQYAPGTSEGRRLVAHELTHVVQQRSEAQSIGAMGSRGDPWEYEAEGNASAVLTGQAASTTTGAGVPVLQRQEDDFKLKQPALTLPPKPEKSIFPPGEKPELRLFHLQEPQLGVSKKKSPPSLIKLVLPPPPTIQDFTDKRMQEALKQPLPKNVSESGGGVKSEKQKFFEPLEREKVQFGLDLSMDSNINFQISAVARHLDAARFKLGGKVPLDIVHELTFNVGVSGNPKDFGTKTSQILVTLFNLHLMQYGPNKDFIELGLLQHGLGFDSTGNFIVPVGSQLELHSHGKYGENISIVLNTGGQLKVHEGKATWEWQPISFGLLIHWVNP